MSFLENIGIPGLNNLVKCKSQACIPELQSSDLSDAPPCKRPLLIHPTNMQTEVDCDKYSCSRIPDVKLSHQQFSLTPLSHSRPTERNFSNIDEKEDYHNNRSPETISKYSPFKPPLQRVDFKERDQMFSSLSRRSEAFKNVNHVSTLYFTQS